MIAYGSPEAQLFDVGAVLLLTTLICFSVTLFLIFAYRQERALAITLEREKLKSENLLDAAILEKKSTSITVADVCLVQKDRNYRWLLGKL